MKYLQFTVKLVVYVTAPPCCKILYLALIKPENLDPCETNLESATIPCNTEVNYYFFGLCFNMIFFFVIGCC